MSDLIRAYKSLRANGIIGETVGALCVLAIPFMFLWIVSAAQ